ncbi:MAG: polyol transport system permease protein [Thermomicrobiales bacterium]|jgi:sorbitol/mannitol transport system permease protein|nr:polyol transport system permease protein [Thermomicrobiales bacterium]MEA2526675.1 polyol transport system permease protein [Thermomicrobiales bacterium]MEA2598764.1 polyol transport system permease protein [Thermomicrobiales bacterium]
MAVLDRRARTRGRTADSITIQTRHQGSVGRWLVAPAFIYAVLVTQIPFILTLYYSTFRKNLLRPERTAFVGLENYRRTLFEDPVFRDALVNTLIFTIATVFISLVLGLCFAELVNHRFPGRGIVRTMLITPFLVMPVASALGWKNMMLDPVFGIIDWLLVELSPGSLDWHPVWLAELPRESIIMILVWRWAPFMMLILLAGMQSIDEEVREAARVDGATPIQEFASITMPHLYRFMQLGALLGAVYVVQEVDAIFMTTQGGPGTLTTNLPYYVYETAIRGSQLGRGAAIGVVVVALTIVAMTGLFRVLDRMLRGFYD